MPAQQPVRHPVSRPVIRLPAGQPPAGPADCPPAGQLPAARPTPACRLRVHQLSVACASLLLSLSSLAAPSVFTLPAPPPPCNRPCGIYEKVGHFGLKCPALRKPRECFFCYSPSHLLANCPRLECRYCHIVGHRAHDCKEAAAARNARAERVARANASTGVASMVQSARGPAQPSSARLGRPDSLFWCNGSDSRRFFGPGSAYRRGCRCPGGYPDFLSGGGILSLGRRRAPPPSAGYSPPRPCH